MLIKTYKIRDTYWEVHEVEGETFEVYKNRILIAKKDLLLDIHQIILDFYWDGVSHGE